MTITPARQMNLTEARKQLSKIVDDAEAGTTTVITRNGIAVASITPASPNPVVMAMAAEIIDRHRDLLARLADA